MAILKRLLSSIRSEKGQAVLEYGMVLCLVLLVVCGVLIVFGQSIVKVYEHLIAFIYRCCLGG